VKLLISNALGLLALTCLLMSAAQGATTLFVSGDGVNELNVHNFVPGSNVLITPHPVWAVSANGAQWVSFAQTGNGGEVPPVHDLVSFPATAYFYENFVISLPWLLDLRVWADDTAEVRLNGKLLQAANPLQDGACAAGPVGCEQGEGLQYLVSSADLIGDGGQNVLAIAAYQRGLGPFGVMYEASAVPEPSAMALLGFGLVGLGIIGKRRAARR
jgi:hypothetical protein